jgi:hypothetical protein
MNTRQKQLIIDLEDGFAPSLEERISHFLASLNGQPLPIRRVRSDCYALKAEYRNYQLIRNLFLTQHTLSRARSSAQLDLPPNGMTQRSQLEASLLQQALLSREIIFSLLDRLSAGSDQPFRNDSLQIKPN